MQNAQTAGPVRIGLIVGSTRPGRRSAAVADWVGRTVAEHPDVRAGDAVVETLDLAEQDLPLLDEPVPALFGDYRRPHTRRWAALVGACDAFLFVTPDYNRSLPAALKNAVDYLYAEWNDKVAGMVTFGVQGGTRAGDHLQTVLGEVRVTVVPTRVSLGLFTDFDFSGWPQGDPTAPGRLAPAADRASALERMVTEIVTWSRALRPAEQAGVAVGSPELVG
ncbi:NADPH-dependent FMN reductase [Micromonospora endolithica]|uniref:NADPH-dependent oxidoreductase n=1 Tax=Micromonospora endolithica TaxID=230091 RepID=A0A3A9YTM3_9ACTN|nr:NAD(P)H-dependent oxidoreductase [Micromonospora endolithica]RKN39412.1 NADPH-dependent oxidoreductase [Micromonospora endolithica]TWJ22655.1 NAD(P)H-dependent FMN reductase [Micromonospora endolithica]